MRGHRLLLILGVCGLLLTPNAGGAVDVPGDPTPPVVTPLITGTLGTNGWYVTNVTVNWSVVDPESIILETQGCDARTLTTDTVGTPLTCYARSDGGETTVTITIRIDKTGPVVTATPSRAPDSNGWYNHALSVGYTGTDATSGMRLLRPAAELLGPRLGERLGLGLLPRPRRQHDGQGVHVQLRRDRAAGDGREPLALARTATAGTTTR